ncbi:MAG TPA: restriction endonuclease [Albitalea sp.]|uniref:restriction endonuclease n=1 Tax=Piscinibacter sp. TaxID=1903157 RepID=UPI002ED06CE9
MTHNVKLAGHDSETLRQVDVLVEQSIGQFNMQIVIDCKDYGHPVDVKGVEEFAGLVRDVRAHQGSMVCPRGFTKSARKVARRANIGLYSPADTADRTPVEMTVSLDVMGRRYFGHLPLAEIRGLRDEHTGAVHTNAFTTGILSAVEVENEWQRLVGNEEPLAPVALLIMGLDCIAIEGRRRSALAGRA